MCGESLIDIIFKKDGKDPRSMDKLGTFLIFLNMIWLLHRKTQTREYIGQTYLYT